MESSDTPNKQSDVPVGFVYVDKVPTQVISYGDQWLRVTDPTKPLVLVIPGNPGSIEFYAEFMRALYEGHRGQILVWGVSHAGHVATPKFMHLPAIEDHPSLYSCEGQIVHKITFIRTFIPNGTPLILVGHSIGCHMVLEILKRSSQLNIQRAILLFPAIESLDDCPRVSIIFPLVTYLRPLTVATLSSLEILPRYLRQLLIRLYIFIATACSCPRKSTLRGAMNYFKPQCLTACFVFTRDIIASVKKRDNDTIARYQDKLTVYYGQNDHWSPVEYYNDFRRTFPSADVRLCDRGFRHAFVLDKGLEVGNMVCGWIASVLKN